MKCVRLNMLNNKINTMELDITDEQLTLWKEGMLIQDAMPDLSPCEREFLITGMSVSEQEEMAEE